jgi:kynurenine formamidase
MRIIDLTLELADGLQTHPAHPRCVVIEFASHAGTASRFQFVGVPLRIRGATGSPIRAIAIFEGEGVRA